MVLAEHVTQNLRQQNVYDAYGHLGGMWQSGMVLTSREIGDVFNCYGTSKWNISNLRNFALNRAGINIAKMTYRGLALFYAPDTVTDEAIEAAKQQVDIYKLNHPTSVPVRSKSRRRLGMDVREVRELQVFE